MQTWFDVLAESDSPGASALPCLVIAEVAQAHDGSLGTAHAFIDAVAATGADAVKFQTHIAEAESTPSEPWRVRFSVQDETRWQYWKRMEFTEEQWRGLKRHADERGLLFLSSPFSVEALELLTRVGVPAWKIASGEVGSTDLMDRAIATGLPILLSTGLSPLMEIDRAVQQLRVHDIPFVVMQCTSAYPCPPESVGMNMIPAFIDRYQTIVGLSDHSGTIYPSLAAVTLGAQVVEVHVVLTREMFGPDVSASVTTAELRQLVAGVRFIERMHAHPVDKDATAAQTRGLRQLFSKSIVARMNLDAGTVLAPQHLALKKPGTGMPASALPSVIGARLRRPVTADELLDRNDLETSAL